MKYTALLKNKAEFLTFGPICRNGASLLAWPEFDQMLISAPFFFTFEAETKKNWPKKIKLKSESGCLGAVLLRSVPSRWRLWFLASYRDKLWRFYMSKVSTNQASGFSNERRLSFLSWGQSRPLPDTLGAFGFPLLSSLIIQVRRGKARSG